MLIDLWCRVCFELSGVEEEEEEGGALELLCVVFQRVFFFDWIKFRLRSIKFDLIVGWLVGWLVGWFSVLIGLLQEELL